MSIGLIYFKTTIWYNCQHYSSFSLQQSRIYLEIKRTDQKYRNRIRSRVSNLKDVKNPRLRQSVLLGAVSCERLAVMTAEVMSR